ncbi:MAG: lytic murein transglycosylase [Actinobacteria bacterium]|nr:lytic murein transglycosylase [Actinomycetota bacterium]
MRTAGLRVFAGIVLTLALVGSTVLPIAALTGPLLPARLAAPDPGSALAVDHRSSDADRREAAEGPVDWALQMLEDAGTGYSQLLDDRAPAATAGGPVDQPSLLAIPEVVLAAYRNAARHASTVVAGCSLDWPVLAGIGRVESRHGLFLGDDSVIDAQGNLAEPIVGPALDGNGFASISDSDHGRWDGDDRWDRAVGLMQFIPSSWRRYGQDGNGDGVRDPQNVFDATLAAVDHLCSTHPGDLRDDARLGRALFSYNRSKPYVTDVRRWIDIYRSADPADLSPATTAFNSGSERRRNPFSGQLSMVAFDGMVPVGPIGTGTPAATTSPRSVASATAATAPRASDADRPRADPTPSSERTPAPDADPTPKPEPDPTPKPEPDPTPKPEPDPTPEPDPDPTPKPEPDPDPTPKPEPDPTPKPEPDPTPTPTPKPAPIPTPSPEPSPEPEEEESKDAPEPEPSPEPTQESSATPVPSDDAQPQPAPEPDASAPPAAESAREPSPNPAPVAEPEPASEPAEAEPSPEPDPDTSSSP